MYAGIALYHTQFISLYLFYFALVVQRLVWSFPIPNQLLIITLARQKTCTFYKDGSLDPDQDLPEEQSILTQKDIEPYDFNDESSVLFSLTKDSLQSRTKRRAQQLESRTSNRLISLGDNLKKVFLCDNASSKPTEEREPFANFIRWSSEPALPNRYSGSLEMPSHTIQMELIDLYFNEQNAANCLIPRQYFYEQLQCKGNFITPLLLNAIYAKISRFSSNPDLQKADVFFQRGKRLIDDFLDVPRVSTVISLCILSLYEADPSTHRPGSQHCRAWIYSGMAYRMCLELGLHNETNLSRDLTHQDIELRRRVFWTCFFLDKLQSGGWERPCMILTHYVQVKVPKALPHDTIEEQKNI
ncbi:fungal-specific transcription factor domain-containing protein, partial [Phycomyces nitens]